MECCFEWSYSSKTYIYNQKIIICPCVQWKGGLTYNAANELFSLAGFDLAELKEKAKTPDFKAVKLKARLNLNIKSNS